MVDKTVVKTLELNASGENKTTASYKFTYKGMSRSTTVLHCRFYLFLDEKQQQQLRQPQLM